MNIREIGEAEVCRLLPCIMQLSEHHNAVSVNHKGHYPSRPYEDTLNAFRMGLKDGQSHIAVIEEAGAVAGFCKVDMVDKKGKLDYLVVLKEHRQRGLGRRLMDWAMEAFRQNGVTLIEVKVVDGNEAIRLYEKYGFKMNAHILWHCKE